MKHLLNIKVLIIFKVLKVLTILTILTPFLFTSCNNNYPIDEDGLLITERTDCYVSNFELLGTDHQPVRVDGHLPVIDTTLCTINVKIKFGTDLKHLYPQFSLPADAKLEPKITGLTDFSDLNNPRRYTVISGNRKVRKTYTVYIDIEHRP